MFNIDSVLYGKNATEKVVAIEPCGDKIELFFEENGKVESEFTDACYWFLSPDYINGCIKLKGNNYYKFGVKHKGSLEDFNKLRKQFHYKKDLYQVWDPKEAFMIKEGVTYFKNIKSPKDVSVLSFDLETTGTTYDKNSKVLLISNTFRDSLGNVTKRLFDVIGDGQGEDTKMIDSWCAWVKEMNPSVIIGHNIFGFDFPYLNYVMGNVGKSLSLGRDGSSLTFSERESKFRVDGTRDLHYNKIKCYGRNIIDTMFLTYKWDIGRQLESYGLKPIMKQMNWEKEGRQHYDASTIKNNWKNPEEWKKICEYAKDDADDALFLYDKMIPPFFMMTQMIPKTFETMLQSASGSQLNSLMVRAYLQNGYSIPKATEVTQFEGAISLGIAGMYKNVQSFDVLSMYPSIMISLNLFDKRKDPFMLLPKITKAVFTKRVYHKTMIKSDPLNSEYHDNTQAALKIFANSLYGFMGTSGLNFNFPEGAAMVTKTGREIISKAVYHFSTKSVLKNDNGELYLSDGVGKYNITLIDTDSVKICKHDCSFFPKEERDCLLNKLNALYNENIKFENDGYYDKFLVFKTKNYIMIEEGSRKKKLKGSSLHAKGLEPALKEMFTKMIDVIINDEEEVT